MFKRLAVAFTALMTLVWSISCSAAAKPDKWLIYWYVCGTDIETTRIAFGNGTDLMSGKILLNQPDREPGDATRCIKEVEKATLSPDVRIFMQAGGTYIWGHEKFRDLNAKIDTTAKAYNFDKEEGMKVYIPDESGKLSEIKLKEIKGTVLAGNKVSVYQWFLTGGGGYTAAKPVPGGNGKLGRYVYDKIHRNWYPREQLPISGKANTATDMGSKEGFISFLQAGQKLEQELYPDGNVCRVLIFIDHGVTTSYGLYGICKDAYTGNSLSLKEIQNAFTAVQGGWTNPDEKPFEVVAFDACIMSVYETALALEDFANYMVASQESTDGKVGLNYTELLNDLSKDTSMSGKKLSKIICDTRWEDSKNVDKEFGGRNTTGIFTESVIDLSENKMDALKTAYENFGTAAYNVAKKNSDEFTQIFVNFKKAANGAEKYPSEFAATVFGGYDSPLFVDLKMFAQNTGSRFKELKPVSDQLVTAVNNAVIYQKRGESLNQGGGLSIYYPLDLINNGGNIAAYQTFIKNDKLTPASQGNLYGILYNKVIENVNNDFFDLSELKDAYVDVDEKTKTAWVELDEEQRQKIEGVNAQLIYVRAVDDDTIQGVHLGVYSNITLNKKAASHFNLPLYFFCGLKFIHERLKFSFECCCR